MGGSIVAITPLTPGSPEPRAAPLRPVPSGAPRERLAQLYADYARFVAWFASRLLTRPDEVEDVVQEVFLIAARQLERLTDPAQTRGWLKTVTLRRAARLLRWKKVRARFGLAKGSAPTEPWIASPDASPEDRAALRELLVSLEDLPTDQRLAWTLRHLHEETLESVAALLGCSLATAKRRIAAAEAHVRQELRDD